VTAAPRPRLGALDLLRGVTVAAMIVVNNPGNWAQVFPALTHAAWNGLTFADLIFPAFVFIMGVAIALADARGYGGPEGPRLRTTLEHPRLRTGGQLRIVKRALLLVAMGLVLNLAAAWPHPAAARIPGVLQRIGLAYLGAALIAFRLDTRRLLGVALALLLAQWVVLVLPFGGSWNAPILPGQTIAPWLDRLVFGSHMLTPAGDPEGLIGVPTSVATALLGAVAGRTLLQAPARRSFARLGTAGALAIVVALAWSRVLPINKALWTGPFALVTSGLTAVALAGALLLAQTPRALQPFMWLGTNPLLIYFLSELSTNVLQRSWIAGGDAPKDVIFWRWLAPLVGDGGGPRSSLVYALAYALCWIGVAGVLMRKRVRIRA
jgi:predicted acyltransferase